MKLKSILLSFLLPACLFAQDKIVTSDMDTIPCEIDFVAQGEIAFVQKGATQQVKVMLTQIAAYQWKGKWTATNGKVEMTALPAIPSPPEITMRTSGLDIGQAGAMLGGGGILVALGAATLLVREAAVDDLSKTAYKGIGYAGYGLMLIGGGLVISAGFQITKAGMELKQIKLQSASK